MSDGIPNSEEEVLIAIDDIDDSDRLRPSDPDYVAAIAASMKQVGQLQAIDVCRLLNQASGKPYRLVFGGHRLDAFRLNGWANIRAVVRSNNAMERRAREIAENVFKADLSPLDQARFVAELIALEKARLGIDVHADGRQYNVTPTSKKAQRIQIDDDLRNLRKSLGLQESVAAKLGLSQQEVSRRLILSRFSPSIVDRVRKMAIASNASQLRQLAAMDTAKQSAVLSVIENARAKSVSDAVAILDKKVKPTAEQKRLSAFCGAFDRMGAPERKAALRELLGRLKPSEKAILNAAIVGFIQEAAE